MEDKVFAQEAMWEDILKIAKVNILTGEYKFIKTIEEEEQLGCLEAPTIEEYLRRIVIDHHLLHPDDGYSYLYHTNLQYLRHKIADRKKRMVHSFRRRVKEGYIWVTFEITVPKAYSDENPWVVFSWKESDSDTRALEDALMMLSSIFHKILKINLTEDTHEEIKVYENEMTKDVGFSASISEWLYNFAKLGNVHEEDQAGYYAFTDLETLRKSFKESRSWLRFHYRRLTGKEFRWVSMELLPSIEYTDENQIVMLYIRDIHDDYAKELRYRKELEHYCNNDILTGIGNRYYYANFCAMYEKGKKKHAMGALFADVNGLKYINDHYGHEKGDDFIKYFSKLLSDTFETGICCRISGDEFIVVIEDMEETEFIRKMDDFHGLLQKQKLPIASVGYVWAAQTDSIEELVSRAEDAMYLDKKEFYRRHPEYAR